MAGYLSEVIMGYNSHFCFSLQLRGCNTMQIAIHSNGSGFRGGGGANKKTQTKTQPTNQPTSQEVRQQPQKKTEENIHITFIQVIQILPLRHIPFRLQSMWECKTRKGTHPISCWDMANMQPKLQESWGKKMRQGKIHYCSLKARA